MQERPEDVPTGELPRSMQLLVDRRLVGNVSPGTRVTAIGIYAILSVGDACALQQFSQYRTLPVEAVTMDHNMSLSVLI